MVFEEIGEDMKPAGRLLHRRLGRKIGTMRRGKALDAFDEIGPARKPTCRQSRRQQPVLRRLAGVKRLAHCPELRFEPGRLGPGDAECRRGLFGVESEQPGAGRRRAKAADRRGRVKAEIVMPGLQRHADPAGGLVAGDKRGQTSRPELPFSSASASNPGRIATEGCPGIAMLTSS